MLDLEHVDLADLAMALEDHSDEHGWYVSRATGEVRLEHEDHPIDDDPDWVYVEPIPSHEAYEDMAVFVARVSDRRAADVLGRAIEGRGAFRRFKDALFEFDDLRAKWFSFHDVRMQRRAIEWLAAHELIGDDVLSEALASLEDPVVGDGLIEAAEIARRARDGLRVIYGERLVDVRLFGSHARGEAGAESDLDLLVVLDQLDHPFDELRAMDDLLWELTLQSGLTVSAFPVSAASLDEPRSPTLIRAKAEAVPIR